MLTYHCKPVYFMCALIFAPPVVFYTPTNDVITPVGIPRDIPTIIEASHGC